MAYQGMPYHIALPQSYGRFRQSLIVCMIANTRPKAMYMLLYCISKESNDRGPLNWTGTHISDILTLMYQLYTGTRKQ